MTGFEVVTMGRASLIGLFGQRGSEDRSATGIALAEVGAEALADQRYDRMSGGERQLILIARALVTGSPALVFDKPTSALDLGNQARTLALLDMLRTPRDRAILFTTHHPNHVLAAADEVLLMLPDAKELHGSVEEMIQPEPLSSPYEVAMAWVDVLSCDRCPRRSILIAF